MIGPSKGGIMIHLIKNVYKTNKTFEYIIICMRNAFIEIKSTSTTGNFTIVIKKAFQNL